MLLSGPMIRIPLLAMPVMREERPRRIGGDGGNKHLVTT
jgi:hypothetical protein